MPARRLLLPAILLAGALSARPALAQDGRAQEISALQGQIDRAILQLSSGCTVACPALASMERAADRICALDPGPRCADARAKVRDATRKVEQACGPCRDHGGKPDLSGDEAERSADKPRAPKPLSAPPPPASPSSTPAPPPPEPTLESKEESAPHATPTEQVVSAPAPRRGGCAACAVTVGGDQALGGGLLTALAVAVGVARRRSRKR